MNDAGADVPDACRWVRFFTYPDPNAVLQTRDRLLSSLAEAKR